jgi:hypothetical protein
MEQGSDASGVVGRLADDVSNVNKLAGWSKFRLHVIVERHPNLARLVRQGNQASFDLSQRVGRFGRL